MRIPLLGTFYLLSGLSPDVVQFPNLIRMNVSRYILAVPKEFWFCYLKYFFFDVAGSSLEELYFGWLDHSFLQVELDLYRIAAIASFFNSLSTFDTISTRFRNSPLVSGIMFTCS